MTYQEFEKILLEEFPQLSEEQKRHFEMLDGLYREWNARINVISRKDIDELYRHHVLHSLAIASYALRCNSSEGVTLEENAAVLADGAEVLDLGTGGGFPGIPLAILFPKVHFTLCDSVGKKTIVASAVAKALDLKNVEIVNARAESLPQTFDWIVSRAVTSLENFMPWVKGKYYRGILYLKGGDVASETGVVMDKFKLRKGSVSVWQVDSWLKDDYFKEKFVIRIEK